MWRDRAAVDCVRVLQLPDPGRDVEGGARGMLQRGPGNRIDAFKGIGSLSRRVDGADGAMAAMELPVEAAGSTEEAATVVVSWSGAVRAVEDL